MAEVVIYRTNYCPYCDMAEAMFRRLGVEFEEVDVTSDPEMRNKLVEMSGGRRTVPQIFIDGESIGGYDDAQALMRSGELEKMLESS